MSSLSKVQIQHFQRRAPSHCHPAATTDVMSHYLFVTKNDDLQNFPYPAVFNENTSSFAHNFLACSGWAPTGHSSLWIFGSLDLWIFGSLDLWTKKNTRDVKKEQEIQKWSTTCSFSSTYPQLPAEAVDCSVGRGGGGSSCSCTVQLGHVQHRQPSSTVWFLL
jgi:hypothetical protein